MESQAALALKDHPAFPPSPRHQPPETLENAETLEPLAHPDLLAKTRTLAHKASLDPEATLVRTETPAPPEILDPRAPLAKMVLLASAVFAPNTARSMAVFSSKMAPVSSSKYLFIVFFQ